MTESTDIFKTGDTPTAYPVREVPAIMESDSADITAKQIETEHRRLALTANQLRIVLEMQRDMETRSADSLLSVFRGSGE